LFFLVGPDLLIWFAVFDVTLPSSNLLQVQEIHRDIPPAGGAVETRLDTVSTGVPALKTSEEKSQKAYDAWAEKFKKKNGKDPGSKDRYINTINDRYINSINVK
jgi:hypothetical protein